MKIALTLEKKDEHDLLSENFGRAPYFMILDLENKEIKNSKIITNEHIDQIGGAGVSVAQLIAEQGVNVLIVENIGPRAVEVLKKFNVSIYLGEKESVKEVLKKFQENKLKKIN